MEDDADWRLELEDPEAEIPKIVTYEEAKQAHQEKIRDSLLSEKVADIDEVVLSDEQQQLSGEIDRFIADPFLGDVYHYDGLAGTGKSVVLAHTGRTNDDCSMVALSAKAASILRRKSGLSASTIHSAIYKLIKSRDLDNGKRVMEWKPQHSRDNLRGVTFLLDEKSMINREIAMDMLATGARIVAAGDPGQLPPVKGAQYFTDPNFVLQTIHRQALDSPIIRQAHRVRQGLTYQNDGDGFRVLNSLPRDELATADMILVWKNATRIEMTRIVRRTKGLAGQCPQAGEPIMCLKNCPDFGLYNGVTYTLLQAFEPGHSLVRIDVDGEPMDVPNVRFEGIASAIPAGAQENTHFTFGYVYTVHKAQGSEADNVVLIDEYAMQEHAIAWRYTAITRAAKKLTVMRL